MATAPPLLSPELEEMLKLVGDADSVELKLTVPDEDRQSAAAALGVDLLNARIRQVWFFDTPDLALDGAGVVVRARRTQAAPGKAGGVKETVSGQRPLRKLFSKPQRAFFAEHAPKGLALDDLAMLGPINVFKLKVLPAGLDRKLAVELWLYPDGSRIMELSTKCVPADWFETTTQSRDHLKQLGIDLTGDQATKTRAALEYFAGLER